MKVPQFILSLVLGAILALQGWSLNKIVTQGEDIAAIKAKLGVQAAESSDVAKNTR